MERLIALAAEACSSNREQRLVVDSQIVVGPDGRARYVERAVVAQPQTTGRLFPIGPRP